MIEVQQKLAELGLTLPQPPKPGGLYDSVRCVGNIAYVAIQFPFLDGALAYRGRLGQELTTQDGYRAAELCALNVLAQINQYIGYDRIVGLNMIEAHMLTVDGWDDFPKVLDGASHLFLHALGDTGRHARALFGVAHLPMNAPVALVTSFTIR